MMFPANRKLSLTLSLILSMTAVIGLVTLYRTASVTGDEAKFQPDLNRGISEPAQVEQTQLEPNQSETAVAVSDQSNIFQDDFSIKKTIEEVGGMQNSLDSAWWVNSGAYLYVENGVARTIRGSLEKGSKWQKEFKDYNSDSTDGGYHPQNIFRLVTKSIWKNFTQQSYFRVRGDNLSKSDSRMESNGLLLFNRYLNGDNLYYTGIRVDGAAVIKKKIKGKYFTMAYKQVYPGQYNRKKNPNLLPKNTWIGVKSEVTQDSSGQVVIRLFLDKKRDGNWVLTLETKDNGKTFGGKALNEAGYAGIRTDFMDVEFDDYRIEEMSLTK